MAVPTTTDFGDHLGVDQRSPLPPSMSADTLAGGAGDDVVIGDQNFLRAIQLLGGMNNL
jgi:hypothetical protein